MKIFFLNGIRNGEEFELSGDEVGIGRELNNDIVVETDGVSRYHAKLFKQPDGNWLLEDLDSLNGCKINDMLIKDEKLLNEGDIITLGDQIFCIGEEKKQAKTKAKPVDISIVQPEKEQKSDAAKNPVIGNDTPTVKKIVFQPIPKKVPKTDMKNSKPEPIIGTVKPVAVEKTKPESENSPEMTAKELSASAANIFGEKGKTSKTEKSNTEPVGKKHLMNVMFYMVLLVGVIAFVFWFLNSNGEIKKTHAVTVNQNVKIPLVLSYVKTKITKNNIFRFSLLIENNSAKFTIDDLKSDRHRNETIKDIKPEFIKALKTAIEGTGFMDLSPVSKGSAVNNLDETREMTIALNKKCNSITIQNNSAPTSFEDIEDAINEFADGYDLLTFAMSPKELLRQGKESFVKAEEYYANRQAQSANLLAAERRYKITIDYLSQFTPKPKEWDIARKRHAEVLAMRKKLWKELTYEVERLERLAKLKEAIEVLNEMKQLTVEGSKEEKWVRNRTTRLSEALKARKK